MTRCFIFLLLFPVFSLQGQSSAIDSLLSRLPEAGKDTNKINLLNRISFHYAGTDPDEGIKYAGEAKVLSEELKWTKGLAAAHSNLGINYEAKSDHPKALENSRASLVLYKELGMWPGIAGALSDIGQEHLAQSNYSKAMEYFFLALKIYEGLGDKKTARTSCLKSV